MTATDIAAYGGLIISAGGMIGIPAYVTWRKTRSVDAHADGLDTRSAAAMFKERGDELQARLDKVIADYEQKIDAMRADYEEKIAAAEARHQAQIAGLQAEVDGLYRRLYQPPLGH